MTTLDEVLIPGSESAVASRRRTWPRVLASFVLGFLLCLGLAGGALLAYDASFEGRVLTGVRIGDVDLSGLDRAQAAAALTSAFGGYGDGEVVVRTSAGDVAVPFAAFSRRPDVDAMVDTALGTGRVGTPVERAVAEVRLAMSGATLEPRLAFDPDLLAQRVDAAVAPLERLPVDSRVVKTQRSIYTMPAQPGRTFDTAAATAAALGVVGQTDAPSEVVVEAATTEIPAAHVEGELLAAKTAAERMIRDVVVTRGKKKWTIQSSVVRGWVQFEPTANGSVWPVIDETAIPAALKKVAKGVRVAPESAKYLKTRGGRIVGVVAAEEGRKLDTAATAAAIADTLADRALGAAAVPVKVRVAKVPPKLSTAEAAKKAPVMERLGTWKTWFSVSERNYFGANIWRPAEIIDGTVLMPGQRFEWWRALGPVTPSRGYGPGGFIAGNHTEPTGALGGGMCSSSTTLFNAALRAGLQMGARSNSQVLHRSLSARARRDGVQDPRRHADRDLHQRHEEPHRHPDLSLSRRGQGLGPLRDLGNPGWPEGVDRPAGGQQRPQGHDADGLRLDAAQGRPKPGGVPGERHDRRGVTRRSAQRQGHP